MASVEQSDGGSEQRGRKKNKWQNRKRVGFHIDMTSQTGIHTAIKMYAHNITIAHTKISWPDRDSELYMSPTSSSRGIEPYGSYNNIQLKYIFISECPSVPVRMMGGDNFLMEYSVLDGNHNDAERHASGVMSMYGDTNNGVIRYNKFMNIEGR